jgi:hypothetical protein
MSDAQLNDIGSAGGGGAARYSGANEVRLGVGITGTDGLIFATGLATDRGMRKSGPTGACAILLLTTGRSALAATEGGAGGTCATSGGKGSEGSGSSTCTRLTASGGKKRSALKNGT